MTNLEAAIELLALYMWRYDIRHEDKTMSFEGEIRARYILKAAEEIRKWKYKGGDNAGTDSKD